MGVSQAWDGDSSGKGPAELRHVLGVPIMPNSLERALTHRSYAYENGGLPTNERLEFLGDSVLGLVVTDTLFRGYPNMPEGQLAKLRAAVVQMNALAEVARDLSLGSYVRLGRGEEVTGGRNKSSILADTLEAVIGAVYIDCGLDEASALVHRLFDPVIDRSARLGAGLDWKTSLQELTAAQMLGVPDYQVEESGPDHQKSFRAVVRIGGRVLGSGTGGPRRKPSSRRPRRPGTRSARSSPWRLGHRADGDAAGDPDDVRARRQAAAARRAELSTCLSYPKSRPSAGGWSGMSSAAPSTPCRCCTRAQCAGIWPGRTISPPPLAGRGFGGARRRGKYLWLPVGDDALLAHLGHERAAPGRRAGAPAVAARADLVHLRRLRARPALHRPADVRPHVPSCATAPNSPARSPTSPPTRSSRPSTPRP